MIYYKRPGNFSPRFEVVSCFLENAEEFLLLHRPAHKPQGNTWGVPAGKKEVDETPIDAMIRETKEETGHKINPKELNYFKELYVRYDDYDFIYHIFSLKLRERPEIILEENGHKDFRWVTPKNSLQMNLIQDLDECIKLFYKLN
jgi:8-oxo-dGTP pyrophosphatase MutT (NUDIX family)